MTQARLNGTTRPLDELSLAESQLVEDCLRLFAKPDEGVSQEHAERLAAAPSYDEFVASLPD